MLITACPMISYTSVHDTIFNSLQWTMNTKTKQSFLFYNYKNFHYKVVILFHSFKGPGLTLYIELKIEISLDEYRFFLNLILLLGK